MSNPSQELRENGNRENFLGYSFPLEFAPIRPKHKPALIKAIWSSHQQLRGWIGWAKYSRSWNMQSINRFINDHITDTLPNQHFVFLIGGEIVGMGSLVRCYTPQDAQIALWIVPKHQGKGLGKAIVDTLTYVAFNVWGYETLYYEHDSRNEISKKLPQKCGFTFSHSRDIEKSAENETGFWFSWKKIRPEGLPDAILQGRSFEDFTAP